jgi:hypothetical protein
MYFLIALAHVAKRQHEVVVPVRRVMLHDVPQQRLAPDLDQRLGTDVVSSIRREPLPPAKIATFTGFLPSSQPRTNYAARPTPVRLAGAMPSKTIAGKSGINTVIRRPVAILPFPATDRSRAVRPARSSCLPLWNAPKNTHSPVRGDSSCIGFRRIDLEWYCRP